MGLGGNTPGTLDALGRARAFLAGLLSEARFSALYRTAPQLDTEQEAFWNAAAAGIWPGSPESLLERLLMFESSQGRHRDPDRPKGPRVLDLDLLVVGEEVRSTPRLVLPHAGLPLRRFALVPLLELQPLARDPRTGVPWASYLAGLRDQGVDRSDRTW